MKLAGRRSRADLHGRVVLITGGSRRLGLAPRDDPCGAYTAALFERAGMTERMREQERAGRLIVLDPGKHDLRIPFDDPTIDARVRYRSTGGRMGAFTLVELPRPQI